MNNIKTNSGGYANSDLYKSSLDQAMKRAIIAFGYGHIMNYQGHIKPDTWTTCGVELMTRDMVLGSGKDRLSLFHVNGGFIKADAAYWLQDVADDNYSFYAVSAYNGRLYGYQASYNLCVRPFFALY